MLWIPREPPSLSFGLVRLLPWMPCICRLGLPAQSHLCVDLFRIQRLTHQTVGPGPCRQGTHPGMLPSSCFNLQCYSHAHAHDGRGVVTYSILHCSCVSQKLLGSSFWSVRGALLTQSAPTRIKIHSSGVRSVVGSITQLCCAVGTSAGSLSRPSNRTNPSARGQNQTPYPCPVKKRHCFQLTSPGRLGCSR